VLEQAGLPTSVTGLSADAILSRMQLDKKAGSQGLKVVLPKGLGNAVVAQAPDKAILLAAIKARIAATR
jgi:3-dehydroquinate synthetase